MAHLEAPRHRILLHDFGCTFVCQKQRPMKGRALTAQLGIAGGHGGIVTVFDEPAGLLRELACGLCLGVAQGTTIALMECNTPEALGWRKESVGHRADPFELYS